MRRNVGTLSPPPTSKKSLVSDPGMHHGTCVAHVPWCMSGSLTRVGEENVPGIPGSCAIRNFRYLASDLLSHRPSHSAWFFAIVGVGQGRGWHWELVRAITMVLVYVEHFLFRYCRLYFPPAANSRLNSHLWLKAKFIHWTWLNIAVTLLNCTTIPLWWLINLGSGNGLVPFGHGMRYPLQYALKEFSGLQQTSPVWTLVQRYNSVGIFKSRIGSGFNYISMSFIYPCIISTRKPCCGDQSAQVQQGENRMTGVDRGQPKAVRCWKLDGVFFACSW